MLYLIAGHFVIAVVFVVIPGDPVDGLVGNIAVLEMIHPLSLSRGINSASPTTSPLLGRPFLGRRSEKKKRLTL